jgi:hypothetical protein
LYAEIRDRRALATFMEFHVFAVWDFMSLLKALQRELCCVTLPWLPNARPADSRLINEIVLAEETDEDGRGGYASHFDLYRQAMIEFGADASRIDRFLQTLRDGQSVGRALAIVEVPQPIARFVGHTFRVIDGGDPCRIGSAFTFGREDLLPDLFQKIVDELSEQSSGGLDRFKYYLLRHVELDGGEHGPMAERLIAALCGGDESKWQAAEAAAREALEERLLLWNAIRQAIRAP